MREAAAGGMVPYYTSPSGDVTLYQGDAIAVLRALPAGSVHTCCTSPPYWQLRNYNADGQLGLEATVEEYVEHLVAVFREVRRVLHSTGTVWLNLGDSYATRPVGTFNGGGPALTGRNLEGHHFKSPVDKSKVPGVKAKDLLMMPSRVALALQADGWWLRAMIPWLKRSAMPESATDRPTTATEYVFLLSKAERYFYDADAVRTPQDSASRSQFYDPENMPEQKTPTWGIDGSQSLKIKGRAPRLLNPAGRNRRNADWWFDSLRAILAGATGLLADEDGAPLALPVNPAAFPGGHFATFPPKLVEPMVLASTSARGCCPACGAPWVRTTERGERAGIPGEGGAGYVLPKARAAAGDGRVKGRGEGWAPNHFYPQETTGWRAGCACEAGDPVPCATLDPFCGTATVGKEARKHGRHFIGIDLSAAYLDLARERLGQLALPPMAGG